MFPIIGPVATTNDVTYVTPSYVVDHSPRVGQAGHFRSWPRGWINRIGPVATTNDVTYVTPSYVVDHSPRVGQAGHFRSWPRGWINRIGPVATTNDVTYVTPSHVVDHSPRVGQAGHFRSWPRGWINRIGPVAIFNVSGPSYEIVYMPELGHLLCVCRVTTLRMWHRRMWSTIRQEWAKRDFSKLAQRVN